MLVVGEDPVSILEWTAVAGMKFMFIQFNLKADVATPCSLVLLGLLPRPTPTAPTERALVCMGTCDHPVPFVPRRPPGHQGPTTLELVDATCMTNQSSKQDAFCLAPSKTQARHGTMHIRSTCIDNPLASPTETCLAFALPKCRH